MHNKKGISGIKWVILIFSFLISIGIILFQGFNANIPKIGEISIEMIKSIEQRDIIPTTIENLLTEVNDQSIDKFDENKVFTLQSYCEDPYQTSLIDKNFNPPPWLSNRVQVNCMVDEFELMKYYEEIFEENYDPLKSKDFNEIDLSFSRISYTSTVEKENGDFFNIVKTDDNFEFPITILKGKKEKQIGKLYLNLPFKIPLNYPFDDENKEICILSRDCGATCEDVINKFTLDFPEISNPIKIKEFSCNEYFECNEGPRDDFGNEFLCEGGILCDGRCPDCECTGWQDIICGIDPSTIPPDTIPSNPCSTDEMFQVRTCKHETCGLPENQCVFDAWCADPICGLQYSSSCSCGGDVCCTEDASLCGDDGGETGIGDETEGDTSEGEQESSSGEKNLGDLIPSEEEEEGDGGEVEEDDINCDEEGCF